jgi:hypothetical protein
VTLQAHRQLQQPKVSLMSGQPCSELFSETKQLHSLMQELADADEDMFRASSFGESMLLAGLRELTKHGDFGNV